MHAEPRTCPPDMPNHRGPEKRILARDGGPEGETQCGAQRSPCGKLQTSSRYTVTVLQKLGWTQVVILSDEKDTLESLANQLKGLTLQCHVIRCNQSTPILQEDAEVLEALKDLQDPNEHQATLQTLTWTSTGRHLAVVRQSSSSPLDASLLYPNVGKGFNGQTLRVAINTWTPFIMELYRDKGRTVYHGYSIDLLDILAQSLNFSYTLILPEDGEWGDYRDGKWTGILGQILRREVDFSVAPLTAVSVRFTVADWSVPFSFRYTGISVRSSSNNANLAVALLRPLSGQVYLGILGGFLVCTFMFCILMVIEARLMQQPQRVHSIFTMGEFLFGSFLKESECTEVAEVGAMVRCKGGERGGEEDGEREKEEEDVEERPFVPSQVMTYAGLRRPLVACWCVFSFFVTSFYTSNLTSLLVNVSSPPPFESMQGMVDSGEVRWGMIGGTALLASFRSSNNPLMQKVYRGVMTFEKEDPDVLSLDPEVHRAKMAAGGYAYIGEENLLDLWAEEDCSMRVIREKVLGMETYNAYTPKNSIMTKRIDQVFLKLKAAGIMESLHTRWWPTTKKCVDAASKSEAISVATMQGAFYAAAGGLVLAAMALVSEKLAVRKKMAVLCPTSVVKKINSATSKYQET
ncbi:probable glutamate receptor [Littorina saxatilis]|uniref:probable glutamate receptor n=1 Tax=Littorina saxatilis TaxID=31220 RepID=UPI0038B4D3AD